VANLIYSVITSFDGYVADENGNFDWGEPDEEVHAFINDRERPIGTYLYGRRMYDTMVYWETLSTRDQPSHIRDYTQIWQAADKVVYSRGLPTVASARTRIERDFDPDAIRRMKDSATSDLSIGGPELAGQALRAGVVDEFAVFVAPVVVGAGNPALPAKLRLDLELLDERRFGNGMAFLRYQIGP
jgi:dihydrofolate reductase